MTRHPVAVPVQQKAAERPAFGYDLLSLGPVRSFLLSRWYPASLQAPSLAVFGLVVYYAFFGTTRGGYNFATLTTWTIWWAVLPFTLFLAGRAWCAVCPIAPLGDWANRVARPQRMPGRLLRQYGVVIMAASFVGLTWADRVWRITGSPRATGLLLVAILAGALVASVLYRRRAFCRYLCPIGALTGIYATTAVVELRATRSACAGCIGKPCYRGSRDAEGCPLYEFPQAMDSNRNCNLCGQCLKSCPHGALQLRLRPPARELWNLRRPLLGEAFLVVLLMALIYIQTVDMTTAWSSYMKTVVERTPIASYNLTFTLTFLVALAGMLGLYGGIVWWSRRGKAIPWRAGFATYAYAYIPLALAGHLAHSSMHLVMEGPAAVTTALGSLFLLFQAGSLAPTLPATASRPIWLPLIIVALGIAGTAYAMRRMAARSEDRAGSPVPHLLLMALIGGLFLLTFLSPMNPRHTH